MNFWQALEGYAVAHMQFRTNQLKAVDAALHLKAGTLEGEFNAVIVPIIAGAVVTEAQTLATKSPEATAVVTVADAVLS